MKFRDLLQLTALRLNNKTSKKMIVAVSFGLIMMIFVVWLLISFNFDMRQQISSTPINNVMLVENNMVADIRIKGLLSQDFYIGNKGKQLTLAQKELLPVKNEEISWQEISINYQNQLNTRVELTIDSTSIELVNELKCKFIKDAVNKTYPESVENYLISKTGNGAIYGNKLGINYNQVYISERFIKTYNLDHNNLLGAKISLEIDYSNLDMANQRYILDNDNISDNLHANYLQKMDLETIDGSIKIFSNYTIVGIISDEYYNINNLTQTDADVWFNYNALISDSGENLFPKISVQDLNVFSTPEPKIVLTYSNIDYINYSKEVTEKGKFFPFLLGNSYTGENRGANNIIMPTFVSYVQCENFSDALNYMKKVEAFIMQNDNFVTSNYYSPAGQDFITLVQLYDIIDKVCIIVSAIGLVTLVTVLVNYGNIICFNVRKRKDFLQMIKNIGITEKEKRSLISAETYGSFAISSVLSFVIGFVLVLIARAVLLKVLSSLVIFNGITISLWPFFIAFLLVIIVMSIAFMLISVKARS